MRSAVLFLAAAGVVFSASGFAADAQVQGGRQCAQLKDSLQRLVCYDRIFLGGDSAAPAAATAPRAAAPAPAPVPAAAPRVAPALPVAVTAVPAPALGDESVQRKGSENKPAEPSDLEATITALKETRTDVVRLTLDNGQVWQQMDMSSMFQVTVGDTVRIEKGRMGGYRLSRTSRGKSGWVRVTRVQ